MLVRARQALSFYISIGACAVFSLVAAPTAHAGMMTATSSASADMMLEMDINSVTAIYQPAPQAPLVFDINATGTIIITDDTSSALAAISIDDVHQTVTSTLQSVFGFIDLVNGLVVGGRIGVTMVDGSTYIASAQNASGKTNTQAGQGFNIDGLTFSGAFSNLVSGTLFAGVDVSAYEGPNLIGSFLMHAFKPDGFGIDTDTDLELYVLPAAIPTPGVLTLAGGAAFLLLRRHRG
jgi:hypothetical protein